MNKSSWQKPASLHTAAATKSIGALIGGSIGDAGSWREVDDDPRQLGRAIEMKEAGTRGGLFM